jgi:GIY-YIG catalytic domain-containing protein
VAARPLSDVTDERDAAAVAAVLRGQPGTLTTALDPEAAGSLLMAPGFYAWWVEAGTIPGVPHHPHPAKPDLGLLYVGISPKRPSSSGLIRSRVINQHVKGSTSSSTFRFVLASLLLDELALRPGATIKKVVLDPDDNARLCRWQFDHTSLTWCERPRPWEIEDAVIALMQPPLNSAANEHHPFYPRVRAGGVSSSRSRLAVGDLHGSGDVDRGKSTRHSKTRRRLGRAERARRLRRRPSR